MAHDECVIAHRVQLDLSQPWARGYRRPLFTTTGLLAHVNPELKRG